VSRGETEMRRVRETLSRWVDGPPRSPEAEVIEEWRARKNLSLGPNGYGWGGEKRGFPRHHSPQKTAAPGTSPMAHESLG